MPKTPPPTMQSVTEAQQITDPLERITAVAGIAKRAERAAELARSRRDLAAISAHLDYGESAVHMYRDVLCVSRSLFVRIMQRAPSDEVRRKVRNAVEVARVKADEVRDLEAVAKAAREVRDQTALALMNSDNVANAEVSRRTGLTTARIAQLRTGTR